MAQQRKSNTTCRIRLSREGFELELEGDREFVLEMLKRYEVQGRLTVPGAEARPELLPPIKAIPASDKGMSVREFLRRLDFQKHTDLVVAFGYYLEKTLGQSAFTPADINNLYYEAKLDSSNTSQMLIQNIKRGLIMEAKKGDADGRKQFLLTNSGEKHVEEKLDSPKS
jgi:hypothetical protein